MSSCSEPVHLKVTYIVFHAACQQGIAVHMHVPAAADEELWSLLILPAHVRHSGTSEFVHL